MEGIRSALYSYVDILLYLTISLLPWTIPLLYSESYFEAKLEVSIFVLWCSTFISKWQEIRSRRGTVTQRNRGKEILARFCTRYTPPILVLASHRLSGRVLFKGGAYADVYRAELDSTRSVIIKRMRPQFQDTTEAAKLLAHRVGYVLIYGNHIIFTPFVFSASAEKQLSYNHYGTNISSLS
jgi:hypothetical protein